MLTDDPFAGLLNMPGGAADVARESLDNPPLPTEMPDDTERRVTSQARVQQTVQNNLKRLRAGDFKQRGIATYQGPTGDIEPVRDRTGAPVSHYNPSANLGYDGAGAAVQLKWGETGPPAVEDAFAGLPVTTDPKTGDQYQIRRGAPWQWVGKDADTEATILEAQKEKATNQLATALGRKLTLDERQLKRDETDYDHRRKALLKEVPDLQDQMDADPDTIRATIDNYYNSQYAAPENNQTSGWFGNGPLVPEAVSRRAEIDAQKGKTHQTVDELRLLNGRLAARKSAVEQQQAIRDSIEQQRVDRELQQAQAAGIELPSSGEFDSSQSHKLTSAGSNPAPATTLSSNPAPSVPTAAADSNSAAAANPAPVPEQPVTIPGLENGFERAVRGAKVSLLQLPALAKGTLGLLGATAEKVVGKGGAASAVKQWGLKGYEDGMTKTQDIAHENDDVTKAWAKAKEGDLGALVDWAQYGAGYLIGQAGEAVGVSLLAGLAGGAAGSAAGPEGTVGGAAAGVLSGAVAKQTVKAGIRGMIEKVVASKAAELAAEQAAKSGITASAEELAAAAATPLIRKAATAAVGKNTGQFAGLLANSLMMEAGGIFPEAAKQAAAEGRELTGTDLAKVWATSIAAGGIDAMTDKLGLDVALGKIAPNMVKNRVGNAALTAVAGSAIEGGTELAQTGLERLGANQPLTGDEASSDYINSGVMGALGGTVLGGGAALIHGARTDTTPPPATGGNPAPVPGVIPGMPPASGAIPGWTAPTAAEPATQQGQQGDVEVIPPGNRETASERQTAQFQSDADAQAFIDANLADWKSHTIISEPGKPVVVKYRLKPGQTDLPTAPVAPAPVPPETGAGSATSSSPPAPVESQEPAAVPKGESANAKAPVPGGDTVVSELPPLLTAERSRPPDVARYRSALEDMDKRSAEADASGDMELQDRIETARNKIEVKLHELESKAVPAVKPKKAAESAVVPASPPTERTSFRDFEDHPEVRVLAQKADALDAIATSATVRRMDIEEQMNAPAADSMERFERNVRLRSELTKARAAVTRATKAAHSANVDVTIKMGQLAKAARRTAQSSPPTSEAPTPQPGPSAEVPVTGASEHPQVTLRGKPVDLSRHDPIVASGKYDTHVYETALGSSVIALPKGTKIPTAKTLRDAELRVEEFETELEDKYGVDAVIKAPVTTSTGGFADLPFGNTPLTQPELVKLRALHAERFRHEALSDDAALASVMENIPKGGPVSEEDVRAVVRQQQTHAEVGNRMRSGFDPKNVVRDVYNALAHKAGLEGELLTAEEATRAFADPRSTPWVEKIPLAKEVMKQAAAVSKAILGIHEPAPALAPGDTELARLPASTPGIDPAQPLTSNREEPPRPSPVSEPSRDHGKPEQITPEEYQQLTKLRPAIRGVRSSTDNTPVLIIGKHGQIHAQIETGEAQTVERGWATHSGKFVTDAKAKDIQGQSSAQAVNKLSRAQHADIVRRAIGNGSTVSAAAVDAYGIKLPEGYTKQGELYIHTAPKTGAQQPSPANQPAAVSDADSVRATAFKTRHPTVDAPVDEAHVTAAAGHFDIIPLIELNKGSTRGAAMIVRNTDPNGLPVKLVENPLTAEYVTGRDHQQHTPELDFATAAAAIREAQRRGFTVDDSALGGLSSKRDAGRTSKQSGKSGRQGTTERGATGTVADAADPRAKELEALQRSLAKVVVEEKDFDDEGKSEEAASARKHAGLIQKRIEALTQAAPVPDAAPTPEQIAEARRLLDGPGHDTMGQLVRLKAKDGKKSAFLLIGPKEPMRARAFETDATSHVISVHTGALAKALQGIAPGGRAAYVRDALDHELRHYVTLKALTRDQIEAVGKGLTKEERTALETLYGEPMADNFTSGAEAIALFGQAKSGTNVEAFQLFTQKAKQDASFADAVRKWLAYAKELATRLTGQMSRDLRAAVERVEAALKLIESDAKPVEQNAPRGTSVEQKPVKSVESLLGDTARDLGAVVALPKGATAIRATDPNGTQHTYTKKDNLLTGVNPFAGEKWKKVQAGTVNHKGEFTATGKVTARAAEAAPVPVATRNNATANENETAKENARGDENPARIGEESEAFARHPKMDRRRGNTPKVQHTRESVRSLIDGLQQDRFAGVVPKTRIGIVGGSGLKTSSDTAGIVFDPTRVAESANDVESHGFDGAQWIQAAHREEQIHVSDFIVSGEGFNAIHEDIWKALPERSRKALKYSYREAEGAAPSERQLAAEYMRMLTQFREGSPITEETFGTDVRNLKTILGEKQPDVIEAHYEQMETATEAPPDTAAAPQPATAPEQPLGAPQPALERMHDAIDRGVSRLTNAVLDKTGDAIAAAAGQALARTGTQENANKFGEMLKRNFLPYHGAAPEVAAKMRELAVDEAFRRTGTYDFVDIMQEKGGKRDNVLGIELPAGEATLPNRELFDAVMRAEADVMTLPPGMQKVALRMRDLINSLGLAQVENGDLKRETYEANKDKYLRMFYTPKELKGNPRGLKGFVARFKLKRDEWLPRLSNAWAITMRARDGTRKPINVNTGDTTSGPFRFNGPDERDAYLADLIDKKAHEMAAGLGTAVTPEIRQQVADIYQPNDPMTEEEYQSAGRIRDARYTVAQTMATLWHDANLGKFFKWVRETPHLISDTETPGFTRLPYNKRYGTLAGRYVRNDVAANVREMIEMPPRWLAMYDGAMSWWRRSKVLPNPATWGRNIIFNAGPLSLLAGCSAVNPFNLKYYQEAIRSLRGTSAGFPIARVLRSGVLAGKYTESELHTLMEQVIMPGKGAAAETWMWKLATIKLPLLEKGYQIIDDIFKLAAFIKNTNIGMTDAEAVADVRKWMQYYDNVPSSALVMGLKRTSFPFVAFQWEAARIAKNAIREKPATFASLLAMPALLTMYSLIQMGLNDDDAEKVIESMRGMKAGKVPLFSALLPFKDHQGKPIQWDLTNTIPYADLLGQRIDRGDKTPTMWESIAARIISGNPLANVVAGIGMNQDPFNGKPLRATGNTTAETVANTGKFVGRNLLPPLTPYIGTTSNMLRAPSRAKGSLEERSQSEAVSRAIFGVDVRPAAPTMGKIIGDWKQKTGAQDQPTFDDSTPRSRARQALYNALINNDTGEMRKQMAQLAQLGAPLRDAKAIDEFVAMRHPLRSIKQDDRGPFLKQLSPIERRVVTNNLSEFHAISASAARKLLPMRGGTSAVSASRSPVAAAFSGF